MQQTVLKEHNLNLAIKSSENLSNIDPASTFFTPAMQNLISTSSTFNISTDTIESINEPTVVAPTNATKPAKAIPEDEKAMSLDQLLN